MKRSSREFLIRLGLLLIGLLIAHLGVTLFLLTELGADPFNVFIQGIFRAVPWPPAWPVTHGRVHLAVSLLLAGVEWLADRKFVRVGTLVCMALGGPIIDGYTLVFAPVVNSALPLAGRVAILALGCGILAVGMTVVIQSQAGTGPNDLVAVVLSERTKKPFGVVRVLVDVAFALIGFLLGGTVGLGTVICAFLVGPVAQVFLPLSKRLCDGCVAKLTENTSKWV